VIPTSGFLNFAGFRAENFAHDDGEVAQGCAAVARVAGAVHSCERTRLQIGKAVKYPPGVMGVGNLSCEGAGFGLYKRIASGLDDVVVGNGLLINPLMEEI
jgi:hypothetical protein